MSILGRIQSFARSALGIREAPAISVQTAGEVMRGRWGRWDSKNSDAMNQAHWAKVTGLPINAELAYASNWLRSQAEYEISSNPVMEGIVNSYTVDVVGPEGPTYRVQSSDKEYNRRREKVWKNWWRHAGANRQLSGVEILTSWVKSLWKAGEFGTQMITDPNAPGPVKMRLLPVHMHRLLTPPEFLGDPAVALGVRRDDNRNPVCYYISEPYIFGAFEVYTGEFYEVKYEDFLHGYEMTEEDQVRGVPWLASSLDTIGQLRDWDKAMLDAAEMLAETGVLWQLKDPDTAAPVVVQSGSSSPMQRGVHTFGPPGYEAEQLAPAQPSSDQQSWRAEKKAETGRGRCIPAMLINLDSSKHNYSSARFDNQPYWRAIATVQGWLGRIALDRMEYTVIREATLAGELDEAPDDVEHSWGWIKPPHVDPTKEAVAERAYLQNGTVTWSEAVIGHGKDPDKVLEQRQEDSARFAKAGLPEIPGIPDPSKAAGFGAGGGQAKGQANGQQNGQAKGQTNGQPPGQANGQARTAPDPSAFRLPPSAFDRTRSASQLILDPPDIRQDNHWECGAAATMCAAGLFGIGPKSLAAWVKRLGTTEEKSTAPQSIIATLNALGLIVEARQNLTIPELAEFVSEGRPVICPVQDYTGERSTKALWEYGHYLTVVGVVPGYVICHDSSIENLEREPGGDVPSNQAESSGDISAPGVILIREQAWLRGWHDVGEDGAKYVRYGIAVGPAKIISNGRKVLDGLVS